MKIDGEQSCDCRPKRPNTYIPRPPKGSKNLDPLEPYGKLYEDYIGGILGLYRGSNFRSPQGSGFILSYSQYFLQKLMEMGSIFRDYVKEYNHYKRDTYVHS